ncbi:TMEM62 family protein [Megaselia abdita]
MLIFSPSPITYCKFRIDDEENWTTCEQHKKSKFFRGPWNPSSYKAGLHELKVFVQTEDGSSKLHIHNFALDGTTESFALIARFVLMINGLEFIQALFGAAMIIAVVPLCVFRILHELVLADKMKRPELKGSRCFRGFIRRLWILSATNRIFIPLVVYCVYMAAGPWAFGEVIDGHWGVVFLWGILIRGSFQPGTLTYMYGFFQLVFCQIPLTFVYASLLDQKFRSIGAYYPSTTPIANKKTFRSFLKKVNLSHLNFVMVILMELVLAGIFWWAYGTLAFVIGPLRTWSVVLHIILFYLAVSLPIEKMR